MIRNEASGRADGGMEHFGYRQSLDRSIGAFGSFAAGVSYISILTGTFQLFYFGFGTAGPAYLWSWPLVLVAIGASLAVIGLEPKILESILKEIFAHKPGVIEANINAIELGYKYVINNYWLVFRLF